MENILDAKQSVLSASLPELQEKIRQCESRKTQVLLDLGQLAYDLHKHQPHPDLAEQAEELVQLNAMIYLSMEQAGKIKKANEVHVCECGTPIQKTDQFCGSCGKPQKEEEQPVLVQCSHCQLEVPEKPYCASCGFSMSQPPVEGAV